jgi:uncharacterized phage protein (TIGR01671 family)
MNREIKFRAFDDGAMIYSHNNEINTDYFQLSWFFNKIREDAILMKCTGLTDNKGKEIYEGDIVEFESLDGMSTPSRKIERHAIIWDEENCCFNIPWLRYGTLYFPNINSVNVIGNIFENPELIIEP